MLTAAAIAFLAACSAGAPGADRAATPTGTVTEAKPPGAAPSAGRSAGPSFSVVAAGDIACQNCADQATARLAQSLKPQLVLVLGDTQYENGAYEDFLDRYDRSWGRLKSITRPVPGNHEYNGGSAPGYYRYFGAAAGDPRRGYYSFDAGGWHLVALNSNCGGSGVGGCGPGTPQAKWLAADLAASQSQSQCTLAYWHHPRFSSGLHGSDRTFDTFFRTLHDAGAELVLSGHDHHYERFSPMNPGQRVEKDSGVRQFIAGTGGRVRYPAFFAEGGSEVRLDSAFGVLQLTLRPDSYDWRFVTVAGKTADSGTARCH